MTDSTLENPGGTPAANAPGHDTRSLGPSDSSDSGSDVQNATPHAADMTDELDQHALELGEAELDSDSDRHGTGERASADGDSNLRADDDVLPDRIQDAPGSDAPDLAEVDADVDSGDDVEEVDETITRRSGER